MNILKGVAETLLGRESESFEEREEKFEKLEKSENKEVLIKQPTEKEVRLKQEVTQTVIKPTETIEIQPIINLEREQTEVHEVIQPIRKKEVLPTTVEQKELPAIEREEVRQSDEQFRREYEKATDIKSTVEVENLQRRREKKQPIVNETVHKKVIEEIQPVIHKETIAPHLIKETQQIKEKIVEAPVLIKEDYQNKTDLEELKKQGIEVESYKKKAVVQENIKPVEKIEIQPIINLQREQTEVHEVIQPISKREVLPAVVEEKQLPTIEREEVRQSEEEFKKQYQKLTEEFQSSVKVEDLESNKIMNAPIVRESIHKKVIEEIQPVIHKETIVPHLVKEHFTIHEKLVEAPVLIKEVLPEKDLGTTYVGEQIDRAPLKEKKLA